MLSFSATTRLTQMCVPLTIVPEAVNRFTPAFKFLGFVFASFDLWFGRAAGEMGDGIPGGEGGGAAEIPGNPRFNCLKETHFGGASNFHCKNLYNLFKNWESLCASASTRCRPQQGLNPRLLDATPALRSLEYQKITCFLGAIFLSGDVTGITGEFSGAFFF